MSINQTLAMMQPAEPVGLAQQQLLSHDRFEVRHIVVHPGESIGRRGHMHRSEHWIAVAGAGELDLGGSICALHENQAAFVPQGTLYGLRNVGKVDLHLVEVRTGTYLSEDDTFDETVLCA